MEVNERGKWLTEGGDRKTEGKGRGGEEVTKRKSRR